MVHVLNVQNKTIRQGIRDWWERVGSEERRENREVRLLNQDAGASRVRNEGEASEGKARDMDETDSMHDRHRYRRKSRCQSRDRA